MPPVLEPIAIRVCVRKIGWPRVSDRLGNVHRAALEHVFEHDEPHRADFDGASGRGDVGEVRLEYAFWRVDPRRGDAAGLLDIDDMQPVANEH